MAIGVEKLKDSGFSGLPGSGSVGDGTRAPLTAPATFSLLAPAYGKKYGVDDATLKDAMTRIAWKNHKKDRKSTRLNSSHGYISYAVFCLKKKKKTEGQEP